MEKEKVKNIIILIVVAIVFGVIGYLIPHKISHSRKKSNAATNTTSTEKSAAKIKHTVFVHEEGNITSVTQNVLSVNGVNIMVEKRTKIYSGNSVVNMSTLKNGVTVSIIGINTKKGVIARFIIVL